jgi:hypothetical protein
MQTEIQGFINSINGGAYALPEEVLTLEGHSSRKVRQLLNHLVSLGTSYLEIGIHVGSTLIPASYGNDHAKITGIDNWSLSTVWGGGDRRADLYANIAKHLPGRDIKIIDQDCFTVSLDQVGSGVDVYFFDGDHSREAHRQALTYYHPILADRFILVVDDFNWAEPRQETLKALKFLGMTVEHSWHLPANSQRDEVEWWNGLFVGIIRK